MDRSINEQTEVAIPQSNIAGNPRRRSKGAERMIEEGGYTAKDIAMFAAESAPGLGEAIALKRTSDALDEGDYVGAGIEATAGLFGLIPGVGDAAGKALRATTRKLRKDAKLDIDNPGFDEVYQETYAETKQRASDKVKNEAIEAGQTDTYEVNIGTAGGITGYANDVKFDPKELQDLPGAMGEEKFRSNDGYGKLELLEKSIAEKGYKPYNILIHVREDGQPFIVEGNHRLAEALKSGRETITADVRYLRGAEEKTGPLDPKNIFPDQMVDEAPAPRMGYDPNNESSRVFHLTKADFDTADVIGSGTSDIGFHVGTAQQATARGSTQTNYDPELAEQMAKGERILPMVLKTDLKPARIVDMSNFKVPGSWLANLSVASSDLQRIKFLKGDESDAALFAKAPKVKVDGETYTMLPDAMRAGIDEGLWRDIVLEAHSAKRRGLDTINNQEDRVKWFNTLKETANKNGYDSFVYRNEYEGAATENIDELVEQILRAQRGEIDAAEVDMNSRFADSYMLLEPNQVKGLFGGMTESSPEFMKNKGGLMLQEGGVVPMKEQMELFDAGNISKAQDDAMERLDMGLQEKRASRKEQFEKMTNMLTSGEVKNMTLEEQENFVKLYKLLKQHHGFAEGGVLKDGGLEQDGGTKDPVSGNDVPPGSAQEEVRDDIPAQLSEGEFVFPADVVRYIGLEKLMMMRQEAKMGLKMMEEMGQMGNSDEATMPDDLPFGITDLIIVDGSEGIDNDEPKEYNVGGIVYGNQPAAQNMGVFYQQPQFQAGQTQVGMAAAPIQMAPIARPQQQDVPVYQPPETLPDPAEFVSAPEGSAPRTIVIVNQETGEERTITFIPGVTEIPQGFVRKEDYVPKDIVPDTPTTTVGTATVRQDDSDDDERRRKEEEARFGPGGGRIGIQGNVYGVSFDLPEGFMPGMASAAGLSLGLLSGGKLPENVSVNIKRDDLEVTVSGVDYNRLKQVIKDEGANSDAAGQTFEDIVTNALEKEELTYDDGSSVIEQITKSKSGEENYSQSTKDNLAELRADQARRAEEAAQRRAEETYRQSQQEDDDPSPAGNQYSVSSDPYSDPQEIASREDRFGEAGLYMARGGLAGKKKPKAKKQMKRGGLASKK